MEELTLWVANNSSAIQAAAAVSQAVGAIAAILAVFLIDQRTAKRAEIAARMAAEAVEADRKRQATIVANAAASMIGRISMRADVIAATLRDQAQRLNGQERAKSADPDGLLKAIRLREDLSILLPLALVLDDKAGVEIVTIESIASMTNETADRMIRSLGHDAPAPRAVTVFDQLAGTFDNLAHACGIALRSLGVPEVAPPATAEKPAP